MTLARSSSSVRSYDAPSFPANAAHRDRGEEVRERSRRLRDLGYREGYAEGHQLGRAAAEHEVERTLAEARTATERLHAAASAIDAAAEQLRARDAVTLAELEREAIALAAGLVRSILGRELAGTDADVLDAMGRAARLLPDRGTPTIRVHPTDEATVRTAAHDEPASWGADVAVVADAGVEPGGCVVDVGPCRIDAQIASALERMDEALAPPKSD